MELRDRILKYIEYRGMSVQSFEKKAGLGNGTVYRITSGTRTATMNKIAKAFPDLNMDWIYGKSETMLTPSIVQNNHSSHNSLNINTSNLNQLLDIIHMQARQLEKSQEQIDKLINLISKLNDETKTNEKR